MESHQELLPPDAMNAMPSSEAMESNEDPERKPMTSGMWLLRLEFLAWILCCKGASAIISMWPVFLHTDNLLPPPGTPGLELTMGASLRDPASWVCFLTAALCWFCGSIGLMGLWRKAPALLSVARICWIAATLCSSAVAVGMLVLKQIASSKLVTSTQIRKAGMNSAIFQPDNLYLFCAMLGSQIGLTFAGSIFVGALRRLQTICRAKEIAETKATPALEILIPPLETKIPLLPLRKPQKQTRTQQPTMATIDHYA